MERPEQIEVRTADFEEAVDGLRRAFGEVDARPTEHRATRFVLRAYRLPEVTSTRWAFSGTTGGTWVDADEEDSLLLTGLVLGGTARLWSQESDAYVDTSRPFLCPRTVDSELDEADFVNLSVTRSAVEARASAITGIDDFRVRFTRTAPIDPVVDRVWRDTMAYAQRSSAALVEHPGAVIARNALMDLTTTLLLRTFPNTTLDAVNQQTVTAPRRKPMRRALQYIDDHLDLPITVPDIAKAAGLSTRGLYAGFRRDLQTSPMAYLRSARLSAAHDELHESNPANTTVETVAVHWGFLDARRFADQYTATYREHPVETLLR
jgi:AraC-like DNA-binding protein